MSVGSRLLLSIACLALFPRGATGQPHERSPYIALKGGLNLEHAEDGLSETSGAGGLAAGLSFARVWAGEFELWVPAMGSEATGGPQHRDVLAGVAIARFFGGHRTRPYVLAGITGARSETRFTTCIADRVPPPPTGIDRPVPAIVSCSEPDVRERHRQTFTRVSTYALAGLGLQMPLGRRVRLTPEVRVNLAATSVIVRPAVGLLFLF